MKNTEKQISIIGVGLIGGSLGLALKKIKGFRIIGIGRNLSKLKIAKKIGVVDEITTNFIEGVKNADVVVLAVPVKTCIEIAENIKPFLKKNAVVFDVGSTKNEAVTSLEKIFQKNCYFIGCHPIAGSEKSGALFSKNDLFKNTICVITPTIQTNKKALKIVSEIWRKIGAKVIKASPAEHDVLLAITSHFPHIAAISLIHILNQSKHKNLAKLFIGNGFKDTTRIAASSPDMWINICKTNKENLIELCRKMQNYMFHMEALLRKNDWPKLTIEFENAKKIRESL